MMDSFLVIFSNISEQLLQGTPSDGCFLRVFCSTEAIAGKVLEKLLSKAWEISEEIVRWGTYFLILAKKTTPPLMVSWEFCEMF